MLSYQYTDVKSAVLFQGGAANLPDRDLAADLANKKCVGDLQNVNG